MESKFQCREPRALAQCGTEVLPLAGGGAGAERLCCLCEKEKNIRK